jgi:uncharacterized membrane protein
MNYNLHPIFVHFPIAFFLLYSLLRLFPWPKKLPIVDWYWPRIVILVAGLLGSWLANVTGEVASHLVKVDRALVEMHEGFASASVNIYVVLLIMECLIFIQPVWLEKISLHFLKPILVFARRLAAETWLFRLLAIAGALAIAMTGLLGGAIVYGISADPLAAPILKLLNL